MPPRKPTHLKLVKGTARKSRLNPDEPSPPRAIPDVPDHLSDRAKEVWPRVAKMLHDMGVLTEADALALESLCEAYADLTEAREVIQREGAYFDTVTEAGARIIRPHPAGATIKDADRRIKGWLTEFGLTPAARSRVSVSDDDGDDPSSKYFD